MSQHTHHVHSKQATHWSAQAVAAFAAGLYLLFNSLGFDNPFVWLGTALAVMTVLESAPPAMRDSTKTAAWCCHFWRLCTTFCTAFAAGLGFIWAGDAHLDIQSGLPSGIIRLESVLHAFKCSCMGKAALGSLEVELDVCLASTLCVKLTVLPWPFIWPF